MSTLPVDIDVLIVGAGVSGLHLGQLLRKSGVSSLILEKSRGVGGRIATRRIEELGFDHGAPYLHQSEICRNFLRSYNLQYSVRTDETGIFATGGMNHIAKTLAQGLIIERNQKAKELREIENGWQVTTEDLQVYTARRVVITAPLPQASELLGSQVVESLPYTKALMGLFIVQDLRKGLRNLESNGHTITSMGQRGLHPDGLVLRANPEYSERYFDDEDSLDLSRLQSLLHELLGQDIKVRISELKKWKYALPTHSFPTPFHEVAPALFLIGDSFIHPDIRGSILSAEALASQLKNSEKDTLMQLF